ncbi:hypothetical protein GTO10_06340 [Candidatus Saccharibacteria bacterium]|nr:hypothetical protein [Candidatus Saccharibacteria bacterium]
MLWAPVLHIYQPPTQFPEVLKKITEMSYVPLISFLTRNSKAKVTLNVPASLTEHLAKQGFNDLLDGIRRLAERGQVELTGSAAYHPLLSRIPFSEISRQVRLNEDINRELIGRVYKPQGFFPPEMGYSEKVGDALAELGYDWVLVENCSSPNQPVSYDRVYSLSPAKLNVLYRHKDLSLAIAFGRVASATEFDALVKKNLSGGDYILTALDGETFGHHRKDSFGLLESLYETYESVTVSDLLTSYPKREETDPMESTWAANYKECKKGLVYPRWDNADSPLHPKQWELFNLAITVVNGYVHQVPSKMLNGEAKGELTDEQRQWIEARKILDKGLHSDQFWWASHNPIWHPKMVERGTVLLRDAILTTPDISQLEAKRAQKLYEEITTEGIKLYGKEPITG